MEGCHNIIGCHCSTVLREFYHQYIKSLVVYIVTYTVYMTRKWAMTWTHRSKFKWYGYTYIIPEWLPLALLAKHMWRTNKDKKTWQLKLSITHTRMHSAPHTRTHTVESIAVPICSAFQVQGWCHWDTNFLQNALPPTTPLSSVALLLDDVTCIHTYTHMHTQCDQEVAAKA